MRVPVGIRGSSSTRRLAATKSRLSTIAAVKSPVLHARSRARVQGRTGIRGEQLRGVAAECFPRVAILGQTRSGDDQALEFNRSNFGAVLLGLAPALCILVAVELTLHARRRAMIKVDGRPEQVFEVRLERRVRQRRNENVEDVVKRAAHGLVVWQGTRIGFVAVRPPEVAPPHYRRRQPALGLSTRPRLWRD